MKQTYRRPEKENNDPYRSEPLPVDRPAAIYYRQSTDVQIGNINTTLQTVDMFEHLVRQGWSRDSIIMIDIDDFKSYNDTFGHLEGDALLRNLGQIFKKQLREVDIACRYAGDEFAIILPDTDIEGAQQAAEKIQKAVAEFSFMKPVTLSFGVAGFIDKYTQHDLILSADKALYNSKNAGKNRIHVSQ